jgi:hypothetical protein
MKKQNLPKQSAPVIRHASSATISGENGVEASGFFDLDHLLDIGKTVAMGGIKAGLGI